MKAYPKHEYLGQLHAIYGLLEDHLYEVNELGELFTAAVAEKKDIKQKPTVTKEN